ncbi:MULTISPECIES: SDR family oxidoreductase [Microvirga]|uniref:SDR family oxidoreductase n=1 Tax=Microvirga TaxID=186650 RepID=UPI001CFE11E9|nr:SDR family oxidoreductase [Microvirga lenta]MCB5174633.1 SDR family oxidoreductase [Microvirga lenta]
MAAKTVLIAGATGVIGHAAVEHFTGLDGWTTLALSRRRPDIAPDRPYRHVSVDLRDAEACREMVRSLPEITHLVYAALYEKPGLVEGWRDPEQMAINLAMLRNLLDPLAEKSGGLRHVSLLQGTKAYGIHIHRIAVPARERWHRDPHDNFYWLQEDYVREAAARHGFGMTIFRPQVVFGDVAGVAMNLTPVIGAYAAICREEGMPFSFPGGPAYVLEAIDARLMAKALAWATEAPSARNETFNITNGDVFVWQNVWPAIADALGVEPGPDRPLSMGEFLPSKAAVWDRIVARHGLKPLSLKEVLGESHHYADFTFAYGAKHRPPPALVSTIKLRQAGFADCIDTEDMFRDLFRSLAAKRILPPTGGGRAAERSSNDHSTTAGRMT